jgi:undecaprenyl-diphosphatase
VLALAMLAGAVLAALVAWLPEDGGYGWDGWVVDLLTDVIPISDADVHIEPFVTGVEVASTALAAVLALWLLIRRRARSVLFLVAAIAGAVLLSSLLKELVDRPAIEGGGSTFPSGSATWSAATLAAAVVLLPRWRRVLLPAGGAVILVFCAAIAWEEWHYPSDIVAGWCLALAWVGALVALLRPSQFE